MLLWRSIYQHCCTNLLYRKLMHQQAFDTSYVAFTQVCRCRWKQQAPFCTQQPPHQQDGAAWLVQHRPDVRLVGLDYLSVAIYEDVVGPHVALLGNVRVHSIRVNLPPGDALHPILQHTGHHRSGGSCDGQGACRLVSAALLAVEHCRERWLTCAMHSFDHVADGGRCFTCVSSQPGHLSSIIYGSKLLVVLDTAQQCSGVWCSPACCCWSTQHRAASMDQPCCRNQKGFNPGWFQYAESCTKSPS